MVSEWKKVKLGELITIKHGYAFDGEHISQDDNGKVLVTPGNFQIGGGFQENKCKFYTGDIPEDYILNADDLIVTMTDLSKTIDTLGYSALVPQSDKRIYLHNQRIGLIKIHNSNCYKKYLYFAMQTNEYQRAVAGTSTGATVHHTSPSKIYDVEIKLPPIPIQQRIATILSTYDDLIENNRKQIKLLEEAVQKLYKEWFVKLNFPGHDNTKIIDGIIDGWKKEKVGNLIKTLSKTKQIKTGEMLASGAIPVIDQSRNFIAGYTNNEETIINENVPVIVFGDHTRVLKLIQFPFARGADGTQVFVSSNQNIGEYYIYCALIEVDLSNYSYARHFKYLKEEEILIPPKSISEKFENIAKNTFMMIQTLRNKIQLLQSARDKILPKLMNGDFDA